MYVDISDIWRKSFNLILQCLEQTLVELGKLFSKWRCENVKISRQLSEVVQFANRLQAYLLLWEFVVLNNHRGLVCLDSFEDPDCIRAIWLSKLGHFDTEVIQIAKKWVSLGLMLVTRATLREQHSKLRKRSTVKDKDSTKSGVLLQILTKSKEPI